MSVYFKIEYTLRVHPFALFAKVTLFIKPLNIKIMNTTYLLLSIVIALQIYLIVLFKKSRRFNLLNDSIHTAINSSKATEERLNNLRNKQSS